MRNTTITCVDIYNMRSDRTRSVALHHTSDDGERRVHSYIVPARDRVDAFDLAVDTLKRIAGFHAANAGDARSAVFVSVQNMTGAALLHPLQVPVD